MTRVGSGSTRCSPNFCAVGSNRTGQIASGNCTATASAWFADNGYLNEAVDHALAAGDLARAVDLVEQDGTGLLEQSKMTTLLGIVKKLPPQSVVSRARLQLDIAWANILLQRSTATRGRTEPFRGGAGPRGPVRCSTGGSAS